MRKFIIYLFSVAFFLQSKAQQNVGIGTTTPYSSAILDLTSTTRALLIPRMTATERGAIVLPTAGMIVYQTNTVGISTFGFYVYEGSGPSGSWKRLAKSDEVGGSGSWTVSGANQYSNVSGSVGIGTTTPSASTQLDIVSTTKGVLFPRMTSAQREAIPAPPQSLMVYDTDQAEYYEWDQFINRWKKLNYWIRPFSGNRIISADSVGISVNPLHKLHITGGNIFLADNRNAAVLNPHLMFDVPGVDYKEAGLQFLRSGDTLASINYVAHPIYSNYIRIAASETGSGPKTFISNNGLAIGYADPQVALHIRQNTADELIRLEGADPMIKFRKYMGLLNYDDIGFIQTVNNDLRIGTYASNTTGDLIIRTGGSDNVMVDDNGDVGIGADAMISALTKLHITNGQDAGLTSSTNGFIMLGVGSGSSDNLIIDNNEIVARSGYSTNSTLFLQNNGGPLTIGGATTISGKTTINEGGEAIKLNGVDPAINLYVSGTQKGYLWQTGNNLQLGTSDPLGKVLINANKIQISSINVPDGYRLGVGGKVLCEEVRVKLQSAGWPDYVFDDEYKLLPLEELAAFIKKNKHLPNIPAAAEVDKEGMELGDMQRRMMEKIEELTLYIIKQQKEIDDLKAVIKK